MRKREHRVLPGFGLTLGYTVVYLSLMVLLPLGALVLKTMSLTWPQFWATVTTPRVVAAYGLSIGTSLAAGLINAIFGLLVAWVLVRYHFPGKRLVSGLIDLPFALPTAVGGIALSAVYAQNGWIGRWLYAWGIKSAFSPLGIVIALTFIGLPFMVRTVEPVLQDLDAEVEEAAAILGANRWQTVARIILPQLLPAILTGFALSFARAVGEYGSVVFIAGNMPLKTEIAPLLIMSKLEQFDYTGATAIAVVMLAAAFLLLLGINLLQHWSGHRQAAR